VIQIQSEYAKTSHADFVAQATKMGELYSNLAKAGSSAGPPLLWRVLAIVFQAPAAQCNARHRH
jgi:hypothetical protein